MFRRRGRNNEAGDEPDDGVDPAVDGDESADGVHEVEPVAVVPDPARPQGPWDADDLPADGIDRLDLGGMLVPVSEGMELRVDVSPEGQVIAATLVKGSSAMQVNAFAAPRTAGIWAEIADEILASLVESGGSGEIVEGELGLELRAKVPAEGAVLQPARFLGADGPRWFVRALMSGPAATDPVQAAPFEYIFRSVVVVRGKDAMAPRDPLPLRLPTDAVVEGLPDGEAAVEDPLNPFERGPEITEIH